MPTVYPLLGDPYTITEVEERELQKLHSPERQARLDEEQRNSDLHDALIEEAMQARFKRIEADARTAEAQPTLDLIDAVYARALKKELAEENAVKRITELQRKDFAKFKAFAEKWKLPCLPAPPQAVVLWLSEQSERGATRLAKLARSISAVHLACNFNNPVCDPLVQAFLRSLRTNKKGR